MNEWLLDSGKGWLALDKPAGLPSHATNQNEDDALSFVQAQIKKDSNLATRVGWSGFITCVHRLDRETAGLVLFTIREDSRRHYHQLFAEGKVEREYVAVAHTPGSLEGTHWRIENRLAPG